MSAAQGRPGSQRYMSWGGGGQGDEVFRGQGVVDAEIRIRGSQEASRLLLYAMAKKGAAVECVSLTGSGGKKFLKFSLTI